MGRPLHGFTWIVAGNNYLAPAFTLTVMIAALLAAGLTFSRLLHLTGELNVFIFLSLIVLCPIWAEHINFKLNHLAVAIATMAAAGASYAIWKATTEDLENPVSLSRSTLYLLFASILIAVAAASRPEMTIFGLSAVALIVLRELPDSPNPARTLLITGSAALLAAVVSIVWFGTFVAFTRNLFDISPPAPGNPYGISTTLISNVEDLKLVLERFHNYFWQFLSGDQHLIPAFAKYIFLGSMVFLIAGAYRYRYLRHQCHRDALIVTLLVTLTVLALLVLPWTLGLIRTPNSYRYNGIVAISLVFAGIVVLAIDYQESQLLKSIGQLGALILILIFFFQSNLASSVTYHVNRRDFAIANRILVRLESEPQFEKLWQRNSFDILLVGTPKMYIKRPFIAPAASPPMSGSIIQCGVFNCQLGRINDATYLIQYGTTRIRWKPLVGLTAKEKTRVLSEARKMPSWPSGGAMKRISDSEVILKF